MHTFTLSFVLLTLIVTLSTAFNLTFHPIPSWNLYNPSSLHGRCRQIRLRRAPPPFRKHIRCRFTYTAYVSPGRYDVTFGLIEKSACATGRRLFQLWANDVSTGIIDVYNAAGCRTPYNVTLRNVNIDGKLVIKGVRRKKAPILANVRAVPVQDMVPSSVPTQSESPDPSASPIASSVPSTSSSPSESASSTASPSTSLSNTPSASPSSKPVDSLKLLFSDAAELLPGWDRYNAQGLSEGASIVQFATALSEAYKWHVTAPEAFSYKTPMKSGVYNVRLGFAEGVACGVGERVMTVSVNGIEKEVDVFKSVGCDKPYSVCWTNVQVTGMLDVEVKRKAGLAPLLANMEAGEGVECTLEKVDVEINAGTEEFSEGLEGTRVTFAGAAEIDTSEVSGKAQYYRSGRFGEDFTYRVEGGVGEYEIVIGLVEFYAPFCHTTGSRVFNVYVNGAAKLEGYDIFERHGCYKAVEERFTVWGTGVIEVRFMRVINYAQVSYVRIRQVGEPCVPTRGEITADHAAHSVPGVYPPRLSADAATSYVDRSGKGSVKVEIDGSGSHTHFQDVETKTPGQIVEWVWRDLGTGNILSRAEKFSHDFELGTTRLALWVRDNACTVDEAETSVTVTGQIQPGAYCYYYAGLEQLPTGEVAKEPWPMFAKVQNGVSFEFPSFEFMDTMFAARCYFFLRVDEAGMKKVELDTAGTGLGRIKRGEDMIWDSIVGVPVQTELAVGLVPFEIVYLRTSATATPQMRFVVDEMVPDDNLISHDQSTVVPILADIDPKEGKPKGGAKVKLTGYGLYTPLKVLFGDAEIEPESGDGSTEVFVISPPATKDVVEVRVAGVGGESNVLGFSYGGNCDAIMFEERQIMEGEKSVDYLHLPTSVTIGMDGKLYIGGLGGKVDVLGYDMESLTVLSYCYSEEIKDNRFMKNGQPAKRVILGIAFDPRDVEGRPYVSTNTLYWREQDTIDRENIWAWANGAVDRLRPGKTSDPQVCLVYDERIVSFLPVSNHDHGVNALVFTQQGDLLIAVGGFTNMGLPGWKLGGTWETKLSAAILKAELSKEDFDGAIQYSSSVLHEAKVFGGDVHLYATGLRNVFGMAMTRDGEIYAADQGPNCSFGDSATNCEEFDKARADMWDLDEKVDWTGITMNGWSSCPYGPSRPDKVLHIVADKFYGHPNLQRDECSWIDPYDHKTPDDKDPPKEYKKQLALLKSPVTGVGEYGAKHWCSALKGEILLSTYKKGKLYRMAVQGSEVENGPDELYPESGIAFIENARGDLIIPRLSDKEIFVLRPKTSTKVGVYVAGVTPWRQGRKGGGILTIGGDNFGAMPKVWVASLDCPVLSSSNKEIRCSVPAYDGADNLVDVAVLAGGEIDTLPGGLLYMDI